MVVGIDGYLPCPGSALDYRKPARSCASLLWKSEGWALRVCHACGCQPGSVYMWLTQVPPVEGHQG